MSTVPGAVGPLLGGLSPAAFLRAHWQKRPLLVRQAIPGFRGIVSRDAFLALATRDDARSRLVIHHPRRAPARRWERHDGPFGAPRGATCCRRAAGRCWSTASRA